MKTALEFYDKELRELDVQLQSDLISFSIYQVLRSDAFIKAKEMEKEQISYTEFEVLQLLLKFHQTKSFHNLYDWFQKNKKQQEK